MTLLHLTARNGNLKIIKILIEQGADPLFKGGVRDDKDALYYARELSDFCSSFIIELIVPAVNSNSSAVVRPVMDRSSPIFSQGIDNTDSDDESLAADVYVLNPK